MNYFRKLLSFRSGSKPNMRAPVTAEVTKQAGPSPDVDAPDKFGSRPLIYAAFTGDLATVEDLLSRGANVNISDGEGRTPLLRASERGHLEVVKELLARGANINARDTQGGRGGWTPLLTACHQGHPEVARLLVANGADVNARTNHRFIRAIVGR